MARRQPKRIAALTAEQSISTVFEDRVDSASDASELLDDVQHIADIRTDADGGVEDTDLNVDSDEDVVPFRSRLRETDRRLLSQHPEQMYVDKNGQRWYSEGPVQRRRDSANILRSSGGPTSTSVKDTKMETWQLFWTDDLLQKVLTYSQMKAGELGLPIRFTMASLKAYIAILYFRGANQDNKIPIDELWSEQYSTFYRTVMSRNLFKLWNRCLRFDDVSLREDRKKTDTYAAMREVWEEWNSRLKLFFEPTSCVCVDEQLVASRCRSPHRIYNPSKPGKFGELIRWCSDANDRYFLNGSPLTKRPEDRDALILHKEENKAKRLVTNLVAPYLDRGLNVTGDRFFTSLELAEELLERRTTYVGTVASNKRHLPPVLLQPKEKFESVFVFGGTDKKVTQQSHQYSAKKKVILLSTMHHTSAIENDTKKKSEIQMYYNSTKGAVDIVDEMCKHTTTRVPTRRWTVVHFHNMLDISGINSFTLFNLNRPHWTQLPEAKRRRSFLHSLSQELAAQHVSDRLQDPIGLSSATIDLLKKFTNVERTLRVDPCGDSSESSSQSSSDVQRCLRCKEGGKSSRNSNKTRIRCSECDSPVCGKHSQPTSYMCHQCL